MMRKRKLRRVAMARKVAPQSIIASNWPPIWNRWSSSRGLSAIAELLVVTVSVSLSFLRYIGVNREFFILITVARLCYSVIGHNPFLWNYAKFDPHRNFILLWLLVRLIMSATRTQVPIFVHFGSLGEFPAIWWNITPLWIFVPSFFRLSV